jgi:hypothetical protein
MLSHGENPKRIAEYVGTSPAMIYERYGKWVRGHERFGENALQAAKPKPRAKPKAAVGSEKDGIQVVGMVRGGGFEPPRHFWH